MFSAETYLWFMRFGLFIILIGLISLMITGKNVVLIKASAEKTMFRNFGWSKWNKFLYKLSENSFFKMFPVKPESNEYTRLEKKIMKAGGFGGLTSEMLQVYRIGLPIVFFVVFVTLYILSMVVNLIIGGALQSFGGAQLTGFAVLLVVAALLFFVPEQILNFVIKERQAKLHQELYTIGPFTVSMLDSQAYGTYEIIQTLSDTTTILRPHMKACLNEYYLNPRQAIQNMADKVADDNFQVICNGLKQVVEMNKQHTAVFMRQHLDEINRIRALQREAKIKKKPLVFVLLLVFPLVSIVTIWFYPWILRALGILGGIL